MTLEGDKILLYCHAGCQQTEIIEELKNRGLWPERSRLEHQYKYRQTDIPGQWQENETIYRLEKKYKYFDPIYGTISGIVGRYAFGNSKKVIPFFAKWPNDWK
jgi:hypothetical protein